MPARILVVDDDPLIGELICEIPRSAGVDASFLTSSTEAAGRLKGEKYDDVFLLQEIEEFVQKRLQDIRGLLFADVPRAKAELSKHAQPLPSRRKDRHLELRGIGTYSADVRMVPGARHARFCQPLTSSSRWPHESSHLPNF